MKFSIKEDNFISMIKGVFLNSGEIHYFRIRPSLGNTPGSSTGKPFNNHQFIFAWAWHERRSRFDLRA